MATQRLIAKQHQVEEILRNAEILARLRELEVQEEEKKRHEAEMEERNKWQPWGPHQIPPEDNEWLTWLLLCGRGTGKTEASARYVDEYARDNSDARIGIIAVNQQEAVDTCVNGHSGLQKFNKNIKLRVEVGGTHIRWPNGALARVFGASTMEEVDKLRGLNHSLIWCDEIAAWKQLEYAWQMLMMTLRIRINNPEEWPRVVASTTPRNIKFLKQLMKNETTRISAPAKTEDAIHLDERQRRNLVDQWGQTRIGKQELEGLILDDVEGALWKSEWIDDTRIRLPSDKAEASKIIEQYANNMRRIVIAVDPATTSKAPSRGSKGSDFTAITVAGIGADDGKYYVLDCFAMQVSPAEWAERVIKEYRKWKADKIIAESNNGGDLVERNMRVEYKDAPIKLIHAFRGKVIRAEPVANLYEQGKVIHVGQFVDAEDQMTSFPVDESQHDDMVDSLVYAITELSGRGSYGVRFL